MLSAILSHPCPVGRTAATLSPHIQGLPWGIGACASCFAHRHLPVWEAQRATPRAELIATRFYTLSRMVLGQSAICMRHPSATR
jgi:hypothetical protein